MNFHLTTTALLTTACLSMPLIAQDAGQRDEQELPIARVTLYSSGVAWVDHVGELEEGAGLVSLRFQEDQIADILKSLLVRGADHVQVRLATRIPLEQRLARFGVDLSGDTSLPSILQQLRGEEIDTGSMVGHILDVTAREEIVASGGIATQRTVHTLTLVTEDGIRSVPLESVANLQITDETLQDELNQALLALADARQQDVRTVNLNLRGAAGPIAVGYLMEAPVWKTSYRLELGDADENTHHFQGWAIVENTSDTDWNNIQMVLASGRPVSFRQDLYTPIFLERPEVVSELYTALDATAYRGGVQRDELRNLRDQAAQLNAGRQRSLVDADMRTAAESAAVMTPVPAAGGFAGGDVLSSLEGLTSHVNSMAMGEHLGAGFRFTVNQPVTLHRGETSMLPIFDGDMDVDALSIFTPGGTGGDHPMRGARVTNSTGHPLQPGPITVLDHGAYSGDAQISYIPAGAERLIAYAADLDMRVQLEQEGINHIIAVTVVNGVMRISRRAETSHTYQITSEADSNRRLMIEHPRQHGMELIHTPEPTETTGTHHRFELEVEAGDSRSFTVTEEQTYEQSQAIYNLGYHQLVSYSSTDGIPEDIQDALDRAVALWDIVNAVQNDINELNRQRSTITEEQNRIRNNMGSLDRNSALYQRYVGMLNEQEDDMEDILIANDEAQQRLREAQEALQAYMRGLNIR